MLIEFTVKNYKSIKDTLTLSMLPSKKIKSKDRLNNLISVPNYPNLYLLKSAILYGANNSGKSNILDSFSTLYSLINNPFSFLDLDSVQFKFDKYSNVETEFLIDFIAGDGIRYKYNVLFNYKAIIKESLSYYIPNRKIQKPKLIFKRENLNVEGLSKKYYKELEYYELLLANTKINNIIPLIPIYNYFTRAESVLAYISELEDKNCISYITNLMRYFDSNLKSIEIVNREVILNYRQFQGKKELNIPYKIRLSNMSNSSIKLFKLSYLIYKSINSNQFLIIDDIDKELHSVLTSYLIEELHNTQNNSQFLLISHDVTQMNNFDKDQVYIVEKDYYGITTCSSVSEFNGLHKKMTLENWYRQGRLGGIPHIKNT